MRPSKPPIGMLLVRVSRRVGGAFNAELQRAGGSIAMWRVLMALVHGGAGTWTQRTLAAELGIEAPTLQRQLDVMKDADLITKERDAEDRRSVLIEITDTGRERHAALSKVVQRFNQRLGAGIDESVLDKVRDTLLTIEHNATDP
jgi:MarR family transcriptional regulator for hemolysin